MKVRATKFMSREDFFRVIEQCVLYGEMSFHKKVKIASSNNWRKFHGIPMKRGWRKIYD